MYSPTVEDHFLHPRNGGRPARYNAKGVAGNPSAGPFMVLYLLVRGDRIEDVGFETFGCAAAIAAASMLTEMVKNRSMDDINQLDSAELILRLGGLPLGKRHCADIAVAVLKSALEAARSGPPEEGTRAEDMRSSSGPNDSMATS